MDTSNGGKGLQSREDLRETAESYSLLSSCHILLDCKDYGPIRAIEVFQAEVMEISRRAPAERFEV